MKAFKWVLEFVDQLSVVFYSIWVHFANDLNTCMILNKSMEEIPAALVCVTPNSGILNYILDRRKI